MRFVSAIARFAATSAGFAVLLAIGIGLFLLAVGLTPGTLPYPPAQTNAAEPVSDAIISHWPDALFLQRSVQAGAWPLWRPTVMSGQPFAANPLNMVWYPPQWFAIILPPALHIDLMIWLHLVLAGVGMRALARRLGLSVGVASVTGIAYALAPRLVAATGAGHLDMMYAEAWFPWILWAVFAPKVTARWAAILGTFCALCFLADVRTSLFVFATAALVNPALRERGRVPFMIVAGALAAGLTAVLWLPLLNLLPSLSRSGLTVADAGVFSLQPTQFLNLLLPNRGGSHETMVYVSILVLILAVIGFLRAPRRHAVWCVAVLISALYALGDQGLLWPVLVRIAPPLLWFRVPSRAWIVASLALVVLSGFGLEALIAGAAPHIQLVRDKRRWSRLGGVLIMMGLVIGVALLPIQPSSVILTVLALIAVGGLFILRSRLPTRVLLVGAALIMVADLAYMDVSLIAGTPQSVWLDHYAPLAQALIGAGVTRVYSPDYSLPQQAAAYWNIPDFGGIDPFQLHTYVSAFESATSIHASGYSITLPAFSSGDPAMANRDVPIDAEALARWNVSHVVAGFSIQAPGLRLLTTIDGVNIYENMQRPQKLDVIWNGPNRFTAHNDGAIPVDVTAWAEGWQSCPVRDAAQAGIVVLPGQTITCAYESPGLVPGIALSVLSCLVVLVLVVRRG